MTKNGFSRTFRYPSADLRDKVRAAAKERGFRSEQAFILAACQNEMERGDNAEAMDDLEARIAATLSREYGEGGTIPLHLGAHAGCAHELPVAVRSDLHR